MKIFIYLLIIIIWFLIGKYMGRLSSLNKEKYNKLKLVLLLFLFSSIVYSQNTTFLQTKESSGTFKKIESNKDYIIQKTTVHTELQGNKVKQVTTYKIQNNKNQIERLPKIQKTTKDIINTSPYRLKKDD